MDGRSMEECMDGLKENGLMIDFEDH